MRKSVWLAPIQAAACAVAFWLLGAGGAVAGPAINQFELKDLEAEPGDLQFQSQNAYSWGQPRRRVLDEGGGNYRYDDNSIEQQRYALEMQMALTRWFKTRVGIEFEKERLDNPGSPAQANAFEDLQFTEVAVEGIVILLPPKKYPIGLGLVAEFQHPVQGSEANTLVFGPILQAYVGSWSFNANLTLVSFMGGGERGEHDEKWDFSYALQAKYAFSDSVSLALEAYGTIDRLGNSGRRSPEALLFGDHDQHRAGPVAYYTFKLGEPGRSAGHPAHRPRGAMATIDDDDADGKEEPAVILGLGLLMGLNDNTPDATLKWSVEIEF